MYITAREIRALFSAGDYEKGLIYYHQGRVTELHLEQADDGIMLECTVRGSKRYQVELFCGEVIEGLCTCPRFAEMGRCKHVVAALFTLSQVQEEGTSAERGRQSNGKSDAAGRQVLELYLSRSRQADAVDPSRKARLVPTLAQAYYGRGYPAISFQVGFERLYVVKDIKRFLEYVRDRRTEPYGKQLTLCHDPSQFDAQAQALIRILMNEFYEFRTWEHQPYGYFGPERSGSKGSIVLTGEAFDRVFDLFLQQGTIQGRPQDEILLAERDPQVALSARAGKGGVELAVDAGQEDYAFFGNADRLYAMGRRSLLRCSREFQEWALPLFKPAEGRMRLGEGDMPTFCSYILPKLEGLVALEDPEGVLQRYLPDPCTPCYYFDLEQGTLTAKLAFRYGGTEIPWGTAVEATPSVKRDVPAEQQAVQPLEQDFLLELREKVFFLQDEEAIFDFLTQRLEGYHTRGEVYVTQALSSRRISSSRAAVGISVSDGLLTLELDTGEFPPEELEALYHSMLKKRKYHRLADGRYLELGDSPYETIAEAAHMLQLPGEALRSGQAVLPAFRGLYLDGVLGENAGVQVSRDKRFREMIRSFKALSESDYAVPQALEPVLRPYQKVGFQWLKTLESCGFGGILADEMGLGKTVQVIAYLSTVPRRATGLASLVVCPASLILNWADELARFAPDLKVCLLLGAAAERKRLLEQAADCDVCVTSYDLLKRDVEAYRSMEFYCTVLDEGQYIKNQSTLASKAVKSIVCRQRFVLTGTPIENRLSELWNLFDFLMPGYLFSHAAFVDKLEKPIAQSGDPEAGRRLSRLVQPFMLRRLKGDVLRELPPKLEHTRKIQLSQEERKLYLATTQAARRTLDQGGKLQILAALTQLRQLCCDPGLCFEQYSGPASKLEACLELCTGLVENGHQILLFSQFTSMLRRIAQRLEERKISYLTLQGSTPKPQRAQLVKSFNAGGASIFLISLKAGGTGLNLTAADVVIHYDPWWNVAAQTQATDRAHRIGQQAHVQVYKLIAKDTVEEKILALQAKKATLMETVSGDPEQTVLSMTREELLALLEA